mgnify:CR=1 FL=1
MNTREQMNIVVVGHVDHGKSTVIGRLLADTGSLPEGKLEHVKEHCARTARPFEYAFLLDALKDEQAQGITIDTARCFFKSAKRDYIIIDAPGHVEFLKNMVSGAARAEAALLVIDAHEGIAENSKRHGYLVSMLGIRQVVVLINKMDLIGFSREGFESLSKEYRAFLSRLGLTPVAMAPISAREGDNIAAPSAAMPWYRGGAVVDIIDGLVTTADIDSKPFRFPVQDIYKFTEQGDERRIIAGTVESGSVAVGDAVVFYPSGKRSTIVSIEAFSAPQRRTVSAGYATGFTLADALYIRRGEIMCRAGEPQPSVAQRFRANIFWMGSAPLVKNRPYKLKIATARTHVRLAEVRSCIDAAELGATAGKQQVDRHDVAECVFETIKPIALEMVSDNEALGRFVLVDNYDIAGGGIITAVEAAPSPWLNRHVEAREEAWKSGDITAARRAARNGHRGKSIILCGDDAKTLRTIARTLERMLFEAGFQSYFADPETIRAGLDSEESDEGDEQAALRLMHLGEVSRLMTDAGLICITTLENADAGDIAVLRMLNKPHEVLVVQTGADDSVRRDVDMACGTTADTAACVEYIVQRLRTEEIIPDYAI